MIKKLTQLFIVGVFALTACNTDDAGSNTGQTGAPIMFDTIEDGSLANATRALGEINSNATLQTKEIGVFATHTGRLTYENTTVWNNFMWNQRVTWNGTAWDYEPKKYWPNAYNEYVSFFAYAPYEAAPDDDGKKCIIDISENYAPGDSWLNYRIGSDPFDLITPGDDSDGQVDLLFGTKREGDSAPYTYKPWTDVTNWNDAHTTKFVDFKVLFSMRHALAQIGNTITIGISNELATLIENYSTLDICGLRIVYKNLTTKGRLVLNSADGFPNWKEIISGELTTTRTYNNMFASPITFDGSSTTPVEITYLNNVATADRGDGLFYIPMQIAGTEAATAEVTLFYRVKVLGSGTVIPATGYAEATSSFDLTLDGMEGKRQGIALTLGKDFSLMHLVYTLGGTATEPSYIRKK